MSVVKNSAATDLIYQVEVSSGLSLWKSTEDINVVTQEKTSNALVVRDNTPTTAAPHRSIRLKVASTAAP